MWLKIGASDWRKPVLRACHPCCADPGMLVLTQNPTHFQSGGCYEKDFSEIALSLLTLQALAEDAIVPVVPQVDSELENMAASDVKQLAYT